jgi:hypothetical protein
MRNPALPLALLAALTLAPSARGADGPSAPAPAPSPTDVKAADALFESARAAMERGDFTTACPELAQSQHLDPAVGTLLNLGECETRAGKLAAALGHLREARAELPAGDFRIAFADTHIAELTRRVPMLTVRLRTAVSGVGVSCDGMVVAPKSLGTALPVDPGKHVCQASALGHADGHGEVTLGEGEQKTLELGVDTEGAPAARPPAPVERASSPATSGSTRRMVGLGVGGAGAVGLIVGGIFGLVAKHTYDQATASCAHTPEPCPKAGVDGAQTAYGQATISTVSFIAGAALVAGGAALYLTAPDRGAVAVAPSVGGSTAGLTVNASW